VCVIFSSGQVDNRLLAIAVFVKGTDNLFDTFSDVWRYPDRGKLLHYRLTSIIKHREHWRNALDKMDSWNFIKESEPMGPPPSQTV
jgi:hypothetical protein